MASIYLQAENLTKSFGDRILFGNLSFSLFQLDRTAIVAKNGSGKSTLLSILAGKQHPDSGSVVTRNGIRLGYLEQNPVLRDDYTILESVYSADNDISRAVQDYERAMATSDKDHLQQAIETMDRLEVWGRETKAKQILTRLRIENLNQPIANLSGGQRKRVALASVLIEEPDILILDEPTNHLDLDMVEWLEDYLIHGQQTLLMVTHDRYFLDRVCGCILEIDNQSLFRYKGNYSYFVEKRQDRINALASEVEKANNTLRYESEWIHRMPKARGTKSKYRIDAFYKLREKTLLQNLESPMEINISASRLGKKVMEVKNISKAFGSKVILRDFSYTFNRFEKLGIVGRNGTGKTTFLNIITGNTLPDSGLVDIGSTVAIGY
ncbi:MAG TPA: ABC-F family ATP-binding cassette domain-containing protein, partial [Tenuifilaceae bacterium]|nr:ABC-F family ATP-binding cassette domain-containing protein [Tenuifilaceae bacterium]